MAPPPSSSQPVATGRDHGFHAVPLARVVPETAEASSFVLAVPDDLRDAFAYRAGQFCSFRAVIDGTPHLRCYSMSSSPEVDPELQVTVKRVPGGLVSNWMLDSLSDGDEVEVTFPAGVFCLPDGVTPAGDLVAAAAGSGITPVISLVKTALATSDRRVRLLYANRDVGSTIFRGELDELAERHAGRLEVVHHLDVDSGFVDAATARRALGPIGADDHVFVCGPTPFMDVVEGALLADGVAAGQIHIERFTPAGADPTPDDGPTGRPDVEVEGGSTATVTIDLDGRVETVEHRPGTTVLQVARQMGMSPPFSCESGSCATCMARLVEGTVEMHVNDALDDDEVEEGWILTCQSVPTSPTVSVVYGYD